jgi:pimeloyl-ACP methyl ester carboxylesterase
MGGFGLTIFSTILAGMVLVSAVILVAGFFYQWVGRARDARLFPPPGRLIDIGGTRLHADVAGDTTDGTNDGSAPPVVFEAGIAASSLSWRLIQPEIAKFTQTVSYDRVGLGWSDALNNATRAASVGSRDIWRLVDELRALLDRLEIAKPRVLVAHSFGGLIATAYAARYPDELAGLILVDPVGVEEWADPTPHSRFILRRAILLSRCGQGLAKIGVVRFALNLLVGGATSGPKLIARAASGRGGLAFTERMVGQIRKLPPEVWPMIQSHWTDPKCFDSMARQLAALPENAAAVLNKSGMIETPLIVLSAADASDTQRESHRRLIARAPLGRLEIVHDTGHWIMLDRPEVVIQAIKEMAAARSSVNPSNPL